MGNPPGVWVWVNPGVWTFVPLKNPDPWPWVWVFVGMGLGTLKITHGLPTLFTSQSTLQATCRQVISCMEDCRKLYLWSSCCSLLTGLDADSYPLVGNNGWCEEASFVLRHWLQWHCRKVLRYISFHCLRIPILLLFMPNMLALGCRLQGKCS
jgi:hypothetical protein